jgi:hypothetical protein
VWVCSLWNLGHSQPSKIIYCLSEIQIQLSILYLTIVSGGKIVPQSSGIKGGCTARLPEMRVPALTFTTWAPCDIFLGSLYFSLLINEKREIISNSMDCRRIKRVMAGKERWEVLAGAKPRLWLPIHISTAVTSVLLPVVIVPCWIVSEFNFSSETDDRMVLLAWWPLLWRWRESQPLDNISMSHRNWMIWLTGRHSAIMMSVYTLCTQ